MIMMTNILADIPLDVVAPSVLGTVFVTVVALKILSSIFPGFDSFFSSDKTRKKRQDASSGRGDEERPMVLHAIMHQVPAEFQQAFNRLQSDHTKLDDNVQKIVTRQDERYEKIMGILDNIKNNVSNISGMLGHSHQKKS